MSEICLSDSKLSKHIHKIIHEISERTDISADDVAKVIELWEKIFHKKGKV